MTAINDCWHVVECLETNCCVCGPEQHTAPCKCQQGCTPAADDEDTDDPAAPTS